METKNFTEIPKADQVQCTSGSEMGCCLEEMFAKNISWPETTIGKVAHLSCKDFFPEIHGAFSITKECYNNGTWGEHNLTECSNWLDYWKLVMENNIHISSILSVALSALSILFLITSMGIFLCFYRSLQCERLSIHINVVIALIFFYIINILLIEPILSGGVNDRRPDTHLDIAWWGNLYVSLRLFSQSSFFNWLCNEGFYLCRRVTSDVFYVDLPFRWFHAFGWGIPAILVGVWVAVMICVTENGFYGRFEIQTFPIWIILGPMYLVLMVNIMIVAKVTMVLSKRMNPSSTPELPPESADTDISNPMSLSYLTGLTIFHRNSQQIVAPYQVRYVFPHGTDRMTALLWWKKIKSVLVLVGFLGLTNSIFCFNPKDGKWLEIIYLYGIAITHGLQGTLVSFLYCFCSPDVQLVLTKRFYRWRVRWQTRNLTRENTRRFNSSQRFTQVSSINGECKGQEVSHNSNGRSIDNSTVVVHPRASTSMTTMTSLSPSTPQQCDLFIVHETSL